MDKSGDYVHKTVDIFGNNTIIYTRTMYICGTAIFALKGINGAVKRAMGVKPMPRLSVKKLLRVRISLLG